jgi:hypothetical protein
VLDFFEAGDVATQQIHGIVYRRSDLARFWLLYCFVAASP